MKGLKTILGIALATTGLGGAIAVGAVSTQTNKVEQAEAVGVNDYIYAHASNPGSFTVQKVHLWGDSGDNTAWASDPTMTKIGNTNTYYYKLTKEPKDYASMGIFRSASQQTGNLPLSCAENQVFHNFSAGSTNVDKATLDNWALATSLNDWSKTANKFTFSTSGTYSHRYYISYHFSSSGDFKLVNTTKDTWNGCHEDSYSGVSGVVTVQDSSQNGSNYHVDSAGTLTIWMSPTANAYGKTSYIFDGTEAQMTFTPDPINTTLSVTFSSAVPDYVDIFVPGSFNGWAEDNTTAKMTRSSDTVFTYSLTGVAIQSHQYKIVACYAGASSMDYNHEIDTTNQTVAIAASDAGKTKSLGNRSYDFATNMPQQHVASGAVVTISFSVAIPNTVDIVYVGGLTSWGTTPERIQSGVMTANGTRKVFTWTIPSETYTGTYEYKVVAMSKYTTATAVYYDHIVYGNNYSNEQMTIDTTTLNYALTGSDIDLIELAAYSFAEGFNSAMAGPCSNPNADNETAVSAIWGTWKSTFEGLPADSKTEFATSSGDVISQARSCYLHCVKRYGLATWTGAPQASSVMNSAHADSNSIIPIALVTMSLLSLSSVGLFFFLRKKKHD